MNTTTTTTTTTTKAATTSTNDNNECWIGVDWGTSNCAAAIYCRSLGRSKWMRLSLLTAASPTSTTTSNNNNHTVQDLTELQSNNKVGRIVPSVIIFATTNYLDNHFITVDGGGDRIGTSTFTAAHSNNNNNFRLLQRRSTTNTTTTNNNKHQKQQQNQSYIWQNVIDLVQLETCEKSHWSSTSSNCKEGLWACVGVAAESFISDSLLLLQSSSFNVAAATTTTEEEIQCATIRSVKRIILQELSPQLTTKTNTTTTDGTTTPIIIPVRPLGSSHESFQLEAITIAAIILRSIRIATHAYLRQPKIRHKLLGMVSATVGVVPNDYCCCIGVPATATMQYRNLVQCAAIRAGFITATCITESTAAAIAYGLSFTTAQPQPQSTTTTNTTKHNTIDPYDEHSSLSTLITNEQQQQQELVTKQRQTILVFDMGGGTTDITIAERSLLHDDDNSNGGNHDENDIDFQVCVTVGNDQLGGDDMDRAILNLVQTKIQTTTASNVKPTHTPQYQQFHLLRQCHQAKLALCGDIDHDIRQQEKYVMSILPVHDDDTTNATKSNSATISITIIQTEFELSLQPILQSVQDLVQFALYQYRTQDGDKTSSSTTIRKTIDEVILIGGASRVPFVRQLLRDIFSKDSSKKKDDIINSDSPSTKKTELCTSINAMSAVAQGCSVSGSISSGQVPIHEIKSAYMLDTIPYSIGVLTTTTTRNSQEKDDDEGREDLCENNFIEILSRGESLPAAGHSTFVLADVLQKGITVLAVEQIPIVGPPRVGRTDSDDTTVNKTNDSQRYHYNTIGEFTFLLHRLSKEQMHGMTTRAIDVGMTLKESGEFVVSIFDSNDPDHLRKKQWYQQEQQRNGITGSRNTNREEQRHQTDTSTKNTATTTTTTTTTRSVHDNNGTPADQFTWEQISLIISCMIVFILYVMAKMSFTTTTTTNGTTSFS